ncbi:hypothetical protein B0H10DRAFT_1949678 [Mycena sp. CBHHK59/15]|nr:hypothetical protein B0H10DRAFT_1949678 [Mycena sp. CBHHK59/15]
MHLTELRIMIKPYTSVSGWSTRNPQWYRLPEGIQTAVCNEPVRIEDYIYANGWPSRAWLYGYNLFTLHVSDHQHILVYNPQPLPPPLPPPLQPSVLTPSPLLPSSITQHNHFLLHTTAPPLQPSALTPSRPPHTTKKKASTGMIAGSTIIILFLGVVSCFWWKRQEQRQCEWVLEEPFGGDVFEGSRRGENGRETAALDKRLVVQLAGPPRFGAGAGTRWGVQHTGLQQQSTGQTSLWQMSSAMSVNVHASLLPGASTMGLSGSGRHADLAELFLEEEHEL